MKYRRPPRQQGGNKRTGLSMAELRTYMDTLRAIPAAERTPAQAEELRRLDNTHYHRMLRLPETIARLEARLADLKALAR
ncbi:hypothetical protein [Sphingomonas sp. SRS2]|uniref:hypothetical protein n=1 Tax=Sphingomonas sp. SRS2 TaxID=133190 RepID=UPI00128C2A90|nr:hypothetical protein [Sphingomonas sp. SRS2]